MKFFVLLVSLAVASCAVVAQPHASPTNVVEISPELITELGEEARTNHPTVKAADALINAARADEQSVRTWEDPMISVGRVIAEREMRKEDGDLVYEVEQKLPVFGKPSAARDVAKAEADVASAESERRIQFLRRDIGRTLFRLGFAERVVEIGENDLHWLNTIREATEQRYETGESAQFDILRVQNEAAKRQTALKNDRANLEHERVNLNKWVSRDLHSPWPHFRLPPVANPIAYSPRLVELALKYEPELILRRSEIDHAQSVVEQTRRQRYPDFSVGLEGRNYTGNGEFREGMVTFSFNFPWGNRKRYDADIERERNRVKAKRFEAADYELTVRDEVFHLVVQIENARREAVLYRDEIIPRSETALESARFALETGRGTFTDLLEARRMLLDAQLMYAKAVAEQYQMLTELVLCCGVGDLEALQMVGALPEKQNSEPK
jgi:cobalt-zinc-cadmium efflux system outer membrane protein